MTSAHQHISTSAHQHISTSAHQHISTSAHQHIIPMPRFKKVYLEITNRCNLQCSFCAATQRLPRDMAVEEFTGVLKKIRPYTDYIYLHVLGEPLMHPDLLRFLDIAEEGGFQVNLTTNGLLLEELRDDLLQKGALRQINISLHSHGGHQSNTYQLDYVKSMISFAKLAAGTFGKIISFRLWNLGIQDPDEHQYNTLVAEMLRTSFPVVLPEKTSKPDRRGIKLSDRIFLNIEDRFEWPEMDRGDSQEDGFCLGLRDQMGVLSDGTVVPCCLDAGGAVVLGNLFTEDLQEIINSRKAQTIFNGFTNHKACEPLCQHCSRKDRFRKGK